MVEVRAYIEETDAGICPVNTRSAKSQALRGQSPTLTKVSRNDPSKLRVY